MNELPAALDPTLVDVDATPVPAKALAARHARDPRSPIARIIGAAGVADLPLPGDLVAAFWEVVDLRGERPAVTNLAPAVAAVAAGTAPMSDLFDDIAAATVSREVRREQNLARTRAVNDAYRRVHAQWVAAAPALLEPARERLAEIIDAQAGRRLDLTLQQRYEDVHSYAAVVRPLIGHVKAPVDYWRFKHPEQVFVDHRFPMAEQILYGQVNNRRHPLRGAVRAECPLRTDTHRLWRIYGVPDPDLLTIADHADTWGPTIATPDEVIAAARRITAELTGETRPAHLTKGPPDPSRVGYVTTKRKR